MLRIMRRYWRMTAFLVRLVPLALWVFVGLPLLFAGMAVYVPLAFLVACLLPRHLRRHALYGLQAAGDRYGRVFSRLFRVANGFDLLAH